MSKQERTPGPWAAVAKILHEYMACRETTADCLDAINKALGWSDLLEACESMTDAWEHYLRNPDNIGVDIEAEIDNARAAIAKARP